MIIQIRGTSGSGKSTVMRDIMGRMGDWQAHYVDGRKKPLFYVSRSEWPLTVVLGHYESPCGGCDTIGSAREVAVMIEEVLRTVAKVEIGDDGWTEHYIIPHILCEGLLLSEDVKWTKEMNDVRCFFLTTPLERCLEQIKGRRAEAGNEKPLNPGNTTNRVSVIERARVKLVEAGIPCRRCSPEQAPGLILDTIRLHANRGG